MTGKEFAERVDMSLKKRSQTRKALTTDLGISSSTMSSWAAGRGSIPNANVVEQIAKYLNVSLDWLITGEEKKSFQPPQMQFTSQNDLPSEIIALAEDIFRLPSEYQAIIKNNVEAYKSLCYKLEKASTQNIG